MPASVWSSVIQRPIDPARKLLPLWGSPRIHRELLKLGFEVAQSIVAKYMKRHVGPPGQSWWTFLRNHMPEIAAMDLFVVPTLAFNLLYGFIIVRLDRRELVWIAVTNRRRIGLHSRLPGRFLGSQRQGT